MRLVPTLQCQSGMKLGKTIYTTTGNVLVGYGFVLNQSAIQKLYNMGFHYLYIEEPNTADIYIEDPIREETRMVLHKSLTHVMEAVNSGLVTGKLTSIYKHCSEGISLLISDVRDHRNDTLMMMNMSVQHTNSLQHRFVQNAIQVAMNVAKLGMLEGYHSEELHVLTTGALFHDIGNFFLPVSLLEKPYTLTMEEYNEVKKHVEYGYKLLKDESMISHISALCALQHQERINGSGYLGLTGDDIHPFAKWIGLLDAYDAMTSPRAYRPAYLPHQALEYLYTYAGTLFDKHMVEQFRNTAAIFPLGISVHLSNGEQGVVSKINPLYKQRPVVRVIRGENGEHLPQPYEIDLSKYLNIMINRVGEVPAEQVS